MEEWMRYGLSILIIFSRDIFLCRIVRRDKGYKVNPSYNVNHVDVDVDVVVVWKIAPRRLFHVWHSLSHFWLLLNARKNRNTVVKIAIRYTSRRRGIRRILRGVSSLAIQYRRWRRCVSSLAIQYPGWCPRTISLNYCVRTVR